MGIQFVCVFPGAFLNCLDSNKLLTGFSNENQRFYRIILKEPKNIDRQQIDFSFTDTFKEQPFKGETGLNEKEIGTAKTINEIFDWTYDGEFFSCGILKLNVPIPLSWSSDKIDCKNRNRISIIPRSENSFFVHKENGKIKANRIQEMVRLFGRGWN